MSQVALAKSHIAAKVSDSLDFSVIIGTHQSAVLNAWRLIKALQTLSCDFWSCHLKILSHANDLIITAVIHEGLKQKFNKQRNDIESPWFTSGYGEDKSHTFHLQ